MSFSLSQKPSSMRFSSYLLLTVVTLCLLWHFVRLVQPANLSAYEAFFPMLWGGLAAALGHLGRTWQRKSFWLLAGSFCYIFLRCVVDGPVSLRSNTEDIFNALLVFGVYYQLSFGFTAAQMKGYLRGICAIWVLLETVLALAGLWAALYDLVIPSLAGSNVLGLRDQRLNLLFYPTIASSNLTISIALACLGLFLVRKSYARVLYILSILVMWFALGLTATRSGYLTIGMALGMYLSLPLLRCLRAHTHLREWLLRALCLGLVLALVVAAYFALNATIPLFTNLQAQLHAKAEALDIIPVAYPTAASVQQRPLQFDSHLFTERQYIWEAVVRYFQADPSKLLFGLGLINPLGKVMTFLAVDLPYEHTHSIYLQVLMEYGLVGLLLLLAVMWYLIRAALRLFFAKDLPLWQCALPVLPALALVTDLMECFLLLNCNYPALSFTLLFTGLIFRFTPDHHDLLPDRTKGDAHAQAV